MTLLDWTVVLAWGFVVAIAVTDIALIAIGYANPQGRSGRPPRTSYSEVIRAASSQHLELPWALGCVGGHWFGPALTGGPAWSPLILVAIALALSLLGWRQVWPRATDDRPAWGRMLAAFGFGVLAGAALWSQDPSHIISADIRAHQGG